MAYTPPQGEYGDCLLALSRKWQGHERFAPSEQEVRTVIKRLEQVMPASWEGEFAVSEAEKVEDGHGHAHMVIRLSWQMHPPTQLTLLDAPAETVNYG